MKSWTAVKQDTSARSAAWWAVFRHRGNMTPAEWAWHVTAALGENKLMQEMTEQDLQRVLDYFEGEARTA